MLNQSSLRRSCLVLGAVVASAGCAPEADPARDSAAAPAAEPAAAEETARNVRVLTASRSDLVEWLDISGAVRPFVATDLSAEEGGVVQSLPIEKGAAVGEGAVVVGIERGVLEASMRSAKADLVVAEYNEDRTRNLHEANSVSGQEMLLARSQLEKAKAAADLAALRFRRARVKAPYDGILSERYVEIGQYVAPGQAVARIVDPYTLKLVANVTERDVALVAPGSSVDVSLVGSTDPIEGTVHWVAFEADPASGKFEVEIHIDNSDLRVRPGVVAQAKVERGVHEQVITIPRDAIVETRAGRRVFVVEDDRARARSVSLGADQGLMVVVTAGLDADDDVIVRGQRDVRDGDLVAITERATSPDGGMAGDPGTSKEEVDGR